MDVTGYNRAAWDAQVSRGNPWTIPVTPEVIQKARRGAVTLLLTNTRPVPADWLPALAGARVLCLASGGGQQGPVLAAAGAHVTVFDNSPAQLAQDRQVAEREGLALVTCAGDMADLSAFAGASFDLVFNPCSTCFVKDVRPVYREVQRVLAPGGVFLTGFLNPAVFVFDDKLMEQGRLEVRHKLPYSDLESLTAAERDELVARSEPFVFGHTLTDLIGGQLDAGLVLTGLYEDVWPERVLTRYMPALVATRAVKPHTPA